jgi:magnesium and cobalt transporter
MADPSSGSSAGETDGASERLFQALRNWLRQLRRSRGEEERTIGPLEDVIERRLDEGVPIDDQEGALVGNILKLHELSAADVMVQRVDVVALEIGTPFSEAVKLFIESGHSRLPVYRGTLDDVVGFIHVKDMLGYIAEQCPVQMAKLVRKVLVVAPTMPVLDLLVQMRSSHIHMAMVVDEFGGIDGLVTIEDLIEEIVGEIEDEHDSAATPGLIERNDGSLIVDARFPIEELEARCGARLLPENAEDAVDTVGGLVFTLAGRVPSRGEIIHHPAGLELEVVDADPRRVKRLRVRRPDSELPQPPQA